MNLIKAKTNKAQKTATRRRKVTILGSTGSVGTQTLDLLERDADAYDIVALTASTNVERLAEQGAS